MSEIPTAGPVLARARLRHDVPARALARVLVPEEPGARSGAGHHLVWALFADAEDRRRDFLWREMRPGEFLILAERPPVDQHGIFNLEYKPFSPVLRPGQHLQFDLRANPVVNVAAKPGERGRRHDVVMHNLSKLDRSQRALAREGAMRESALAWLVRKGAIAGFRIEPDHLHIDRYEHVRVPREGARAVIFSALTFQGMLEVKDPARFVSSILAGFGAAKAFGCGLMLIRRAPR